MLFLLQTYFGTQRRQRLRLNRVQPVLYSYNILFYLSLT